ncbi:unnamed protein product [Clonostachys rosea f. rosea IK726]|uniref:Uncharacterized protein n=1 Tax=Clonostachys rosea f. rosea IK726 TaxID=1349383 RepID=A0ACA9U7K8_BIOOC|nr:unnamed protein product [Clonostachys rosea f. rosea IK726]
MPAKPKISPYDCNPLQYSMSENQPEIAKMLLDHGASTLSNAWIIKNEYLAHCNYSIAVSAFSGEMLLPLLPNILSRFLEEGGDFLQLTNSLGPIPRALRSRNIQGVRTILEFLSENSVQISRRSQLEPQEVVPSILNRLYEFDQDGWGPSTPLLYATFYDLVELMQLLLENGADPDALDSDDDSPFAVVQSSPAARLLVEWNASIPPFMIIANMKTISKQLEFIIKPGKTASASQNALRIALNHVLGRSISCQTYYRESIDVDNWGFVRDLELVGKSIFSTRPTFSINLNHSTGW